MNPLILPILVFVLRGTSIGNLTYIDTFRMELLLDRLWNITELLEKAHKQLNSVSNSLESASRKSRTIAGKLKKVEQLDEGSAARLLGEDNEDVPTDSIDQITF